MLKFVISILFGFLFFTSTAQDWRLKKDQNGIQIYTRSLPKSNFKEYKATAQINASLDTILDELWNAPQYKDGCAPGVSYSLGNYSHNARIFYAKKELPWPIKDRDIITLLTFHRISDKKVKLTLESLPDQLPELPKTIRIKELMGHWLLEALPNNTVRVTQQLYVNPEGNLPAVVTNSLLVKGPFKTFNELKESTEKTYVAE